MDFFRSVFADDEPPPSKSNPESSSQDPASTHPEQQHSSPPHDELQTPPSSDSGLNGGGGVWSLGGLVKTFATRSESVIETYRRDLKEFGSGLKKETESLREVANRAVKELPPIEINASKAQGAIDSIGSTLWKSTAGVIAQGTESLLSDGADSRAAGRNTSPGDKDAECSSERYSRFDSRLRAIQCDVHTYIDEPESGDEYGKWKSGFDLSEKSEEMEGLIAENCVVGEMYEKMVVPGSVDHETFWCRYYYQVHRLVQADSARAKLVATSIDDEEELSWDVDDEAEEEVGNELSNKLDNDGGKGENSGKKDASIEKYVRDDVKERAPLEDAKGKAPIVLEEKREEVTQSSVDGDKIHLDAAIQAVGNEKVLDEDFQAKLGSESLNNVESIQKVNVIEPASDVKSACVETVQGDASVKDNMDESTKKSMEKVSSKAEAHVEEEPGQKSGGSVKPKLLSTQNEEEELGWDEIEDLGSDDDEKKVAPRTISDRTEIRKRLSVAEDDDEDLSWDIEDD